MAKGGSRSSSSGGGGNITWSGPRMKPSGRTVRVTADHGGGQRPITRDQVRNKSTSTLGALKNAALNVVGRGESISGYNDRFARDRGFSDYGRYQASKGLDRQGRPLNPRDESDSDTSRLAETMAKAQVQPQEPSWGGYQWNPMDERQRLLGLLGMRTQSGHSWGYSPGLLMALAGLGLFGRRF